MLPLDDLRVIDLTVARAGPTCVRQLADWGADVIRIEPPTARSAGSDDGRRDSDFQNLHRNKRRRRLDLKQAEGRALLMRLVDGADVLVENMRPPVKHRLGFDYETRARAQPSARLRVDLGLRPGRPVRRARRRRPDRAGHGRADERDRPARHGADPRRASRSPTSRPGCTSRSASSCALHERERTGEGRWVQTSLLESMIAMMDLQAARWTIDGVVPAQEGNHHPTLVPMGCFETADGYVNIAGPTGRLLRQLLQGRSVCPSCRRIRASTHPANRHRNRGALNELVGDAPAHAHDRRVGRGAERGRCAVRPGLRDRRGLRRPAGAHLGMVSTVTSPTLGPLGILRNAVTLAGGPPTVRSASPEAGEHTTALLLELGLSADEIEDLRQRHVVS